MASALIGTIVGALVAGWPADRWGRRTTLMIIAVLYFVSAVGTALAWDWWSFLFFRFIGGIGVGGASVVSPMYIAEISPARAWPTGRGDAIQHRAGHPAGVFLEPGRGPPGSGAHRVALDVWCRGRAGRVVLLSLVSDPRSPRWLVSQGRFDEAHAVLSRLGTDSGSVDQAIHDIRESLDLEHHSLQEPFFQPKYRTPILLAVAIAMFNQLSGINALMYYAPHIFRMSGAGEDAALWQAVAVGGINLVFTMMALAVIDHFGRKNLMLVGSLGYIVSLATVAAAFYAYATEFSAVREAIRAYDVAVAQSGGQLTPLVAQARQVLEQAKDQASTGGTIVLIGLLVFIAAHAFGQGAVIWVFISEIFPNRVRARGQALGSFTHWVMAALISWTFPVIADWSGGHTFAFYAAMMVLQLVWVLTVMPETKGVPLEQIQRKLGIE